MSLVRIFLDWSAPEKELGECIDIARRSLKDKKAFNVLKKLIP